MFSLCSVGGQSLNHLFVQKFYVSIWQLSFWDCWVELLTFINCDTISYLTVGLPPFLPQRLLDNFSKILKRTVNDAPFKCLKPTSLYILANPAGQCIRNHSLISFCNHFICNPFRNVQENSFFMWKIMFLVAQFIWVLCVFVSTNDSNSKVWFLSLN